jgi:phytoene dehydrogenase-like protein
MSNYQYDAIVVGAGPNGLAAAITLARNGFSVLLLEAGNEVGGCVRSAPLTLPGFVHDVCSSIYPLALGSPFFRSLPLARHGLEWIHSDFPVAHPLDDGKAIALAPSLTATAELMESDGPAYARLVQPFVQEWQNLLSEILQPLLHCPENFLLLGKFGLAAVQSAEGLSRRRFQREPAQALFAGLTAHSILPLRQTATAAVGLVLAALAHAVGWPLARGGAGSISKALAAYFRELGGQIQTNCAVGNLDELPTARVVLLNVSPRQVLNMAGHRLPANYRDALARYRMGPGVFKIDYALACPIPWAAPVCRKAGTVHLGGTLREIAEAESQVARGNHPENPFALLAQHSLFDPTRAPLGKHTAWAYCHVPSGSELDMTQRIESQIERFAPGFRDCVLARHTRNCRALEHDNPNLIGGDIAGGMADLRQMIARPVWGAVPYQTPVKGLYLCSASTPPGGGVHGMCGFNAAQCALRFLNKNI